LQDRPAADETVSATSSPWHEWYREYETRWTAKVQPILDRFPDRADVIRKHLKPTLVPLPAAVERLQAASESDVQWLIGAFRDERRTWFVDDIAARARFLPGALFEPMLRASVEEVNPSFNRRFVEPCMRVFGPRRVNQYLLAVLESGDDFHKAGAVCALCWANVAVSYRLTYPITGLSGISCVKRIDDDACGRCGKPRSVRFSKERWARSVRPRLRQRPCALAFYAFDGEKRSS